MPRALVVVAVACTFIACQKKQPSAAPEPVAEAPHVEPVLDETPEPVKVTADLVKRYVDYRRKVLEVTRTEIGALAERALKVEEDATADQLALLEETAKLQERLEASTLKLQQEAGLSLEQDEVLEDLVTDIASVALIAERAPDITPMIELMKANVKNAPPERKAEIEAQIAQMEANTKNLTGYTEARATWGDEAVDAVLVHIDALRTMQKEAIELFTKLR